MKYIIQLFKTSGEEGAVGYWKDTNWGTFDDHDKAMKNAEKILATGKFAGVRVVENLWEKFYSAPKN
ncbi:MAG: hypothetical protein NTV38_13065 [Chloroflexi bacterium]|nr:hypothetical protein [Chloroflexota bacterium]